jgi:hypothetical protein
MDPIIVPNVRWGEWISEGWQMFAVRWRVWVLQSLIIFLITAIPVVFMYGWIFSAPIIEGQNGPVRDMPPIFAVVALLAVPLMMLGYIYFWGGLWRTATKQLRGEDISVWDLFYSGNLFLQVLTASIPIGILYIVGSLLCFLPAFIVKGLFHFTIPLIVDRQMSAGSALGASFNATKGHWVMFSLFALVISLLGAMGVFICYVGLLVTYPLQFTILAIAYRDTFGIAGAHSFAPISTATANSYSGQSWTVAPPQVQSVPADPPPPRPLFSQSAETQQQPVLHCSQCGNAITRVAKFCNLCGSPLQA